VRRSVPWWFAPFVGSIIAVVGALVSVWIVAWIVMRPVGEAMGKAMGKALAEGIGEAFQRFWVPPERSPDLDLAPATPGYLGTLDGTGHQLHFHNTKEGVTSIAVEAWALGERVRIVVGEYDGPPTTAVTPDRVRPMEPLLPVLVVRTAAPEVWFGGPAPPETEWRCPVEGGGLNLLVFFGPVTIRTGDGPRYPLPEVATNETVWCTLGPEGLGIERREAR
jgi:hypothetical protein